MLRENRALNQARPISFEVDIKRYPEGSCLIKFGNTHVLCTASIEESVPVFMKHQGKGWVTAEYSMLAYGGNKTNGRSLEIQRLISRSLRAGIDSKILGERQIIINCEVIQADGGTRTAAITGGFVALHAACQKLMRQEILKSNPIKHQIIGISCGIVKGEVMLDLNYEEDSRAMVDANFVMTETGKIVEIQASAENSLFSEEDFTKMLSFARNSISDIAKLQKEAMNS